MTCEIIHKHRMPTAKISQGKITYRDHVLGGLELPEGDIDGDTTLTLGL